VLADTVGLRPTSAGARVRVEGGRIRRHREPRDRAVRLNEEQHERGAPLREALIEAGIRRVRPVRITVGATVLALFPRAVHRGPLWEALCYAQIGGLTLATAVTLFLVPVFYAVFVLDLKIVRWESGPPAPEVRGVSI